MAAKKLPIGIEFFDSMIEDGYYYVDKTLFIRDIIDKGAAFTLCTRPRRFGKTLNQTMLKNFFEDTAPIGGKDTRPLFNGLKIESAGDEYMKHQGKYPVIFLSFKDAKQNTYEKSYNMLKNEIVEEFTRHAYVLNSITDINDQEMFEKLRNRKGTEEDYASSIKFLCRCLKKHHGKKTIILIDEYDVPLENAWSQKFYLDMIGFVRPLMSSALKGNEHLQLAVMTGCLRISKESIFTGLNNLDVISILDKYYSEYFGFTQIEIDAMLEYYDLMNKRETVREWYNGYLFGDAEVYNPWSSIQVISKWLADINELPKPHWANTSSNDIVRQLLENSNAGARAELETLMSGGVISKRLHEDITYDEIYNDMDNLWNFLFFTGYLKKVGERREGLHTILELSIPNLEIQYIYETKIQNWFNEKIKERDFSQFFESLLSGNAEAVKDELNQCLLKSISYLDGQEDFYHGMMLGILFRLEDYIVKSNRETGYGRCDIVARHGSSRGKAILIECKWTRKKSEQAVDLQKECDDALKQIEDNQYARELKSENYTEILKYGIAFCGKYCEVKTANIESN